MTTKNFTYSELETYYTNKETIFFHYKKCFILSKNNNTFKFTEFKAAKTSPGELPHTKRGRFHAFKKDSSYCYEYNFKNS
jgi:hypothetical protein